MPKPIAETRTTIKAGKAKRKVTRDVNEAPRRDLLQPVGGGSVRRVEFEAEEPQVRTAEVQYQPKHTASMDHIHFEVDNIERLQRGTEPRRAEPVESRRVFETKQGGVNAADVDTHRGRRRVLYTERKRGNRTEETRFHSGLVDKIIAERYKDGPTFEAVDDEKPRFGLFKKKDAETQTRRKTTTTRTVTKGGKTTTTTKTEVRGWAPESTSDMVDRKTSSKSTAATYSDYKGESRHVIDVEGIGTTYAKKLGAAGVRTTARLCYEDAAELAKRADIPQDKIEQWQAMSTLMKVNGIGPQMAEALVRSGIDMDALKRRKSAALAADVKEFLAGLKTPIVGRAPGEKSFDAWKAEAKTMRRVKQDVPVE